MPSSFVVSHGAIRLRVKVFDTVAEVNKAFRHEWTAVDQLPPRGCFVYSFFASTGGKKLTGWITLCENSRLFELVPHEVYHAVRFHFDRLGIDDEEKIATAVGCLSARILDRLDNDGD